MKKSVFFGLLVLMLGMGLFLACDDDVTSGNGNGNTVIITQITDIYNGSNAFVDILDDYLDSSSSQFIQGNGTVSSGTLKVEPIDWEATKSLKPVYWAGRGDYFITLKLYNDIGIGVYWFIYSADGENPSTYSISNASTTIPFNKFIKRTY